VLGTAIGVSVLIGALLVGESVRGSLRDLLVQRLGATAYLVSADHFFEADLARRVAEKLGAGVADACPVIAIEAVVVNERTRGRAYGVKLYGVDERFWRFQHLAPPAHSATAASVGTGLASTLDIREGDSLLVRVEGRRDAPREALFGRRDDIGKSFRTTAQAIASPTQLGDFSLVPTQGLVKVLFVPLNRLQRVLDESGGANAILLSHAAAEHASRIDAALQGVLAPRDAGLTLRPFADRSGVAVESRRVFIGDQLAASSAQAVRDLGRTPTGVFTYLANTIRARGREIPYSVIAAVDTPTADSSGVGVGPSDPIWLSRWAEQDLGVSPGDTIDVDYFVWLESGALATRTARFSVARPRPDAAELDESYAPSFPGVTDARTMTGWDPPFPLDLGRIRPRDEDYWQRFHATPKAVIPLSVGQRLWGTRFGRLSSIRVQGVSSDAIADALRRRLTPAASGFITTAVRARGLEAAAGSTDFGEYFGYFSGFLIIAALVLSGLFFRLGIEQRSAEIGVLLAVGFPIRAVVRQFVTEGAVLALLGSTLGIGGALAYGSAMMAGLRTWWVGAVGTDQLSLHLSAGLCVAGAVGGMVVSLGVIVITVIGLRHESARGLLLGGNEGPSNHTVGGHRPKWMAVGSAACGAALIAAAMGGWVGETEAFFGAGVLVLAASLSAVALELRRRARHPVSGRGRAGLSRLAFRNVSARPGRSLLCVALIACATFVIVSVEGFRRNGSTDTGPQSGTGGYPLWAQSSLPVVANPASVAGREALGIPASELPEFATLSFVPFRLRVGDDSSCLNLYAPVEPRILGATPEFLAQRRFAFASSLAETDEQRANPWTLLNRTDPDGAVAAIGDANTIQYVWHRVIGDEIRVTGDDGGVIRLRLVAALRDSMLQGELVIADSHFRRVFPRIEGYRFFLLEASSPPSAALVSSLQDRLADWGMAIERSGDRLAAYHQVENTYLSTFQLLGALGLVLGTVGLAAVLLRNALERRRWLALLRAVGYRRVDIATMVVAENLWLIVVGLACGTVAALLASAPVMLARGGSVPAGMMVGVLAGVFVVGLVASVIAARVASRGPLLEALRR
jgi:ABC-type lipoprotein release transport system permease subunit